MDGNERGSSVHFPHCKQSHRTVILTSGMGFTMPGLPWSWNSLKRWSCSFSQLLGEQSEISGLQSLPAARSCLGMALEERGSENGFQKRFPAELLPWRLH